MAIRENIIKLREMNQITQEQLAEIAGVSRGAVSQWEGGFSEPRMGAIQDGFIHINVAAQSYDFPERTIYPEEHNGTWLTTFLPCSVMYALKQRTLRQNSTK